MYQITSWISSKSGNTTISKIYLMRYAIWYHLYNLKNVKNTQRGVLLLAEACNYTKSNTPPWLFITFFKLYEWYQIAQRITKIRELWSLIPLKTLEVKLLRVYVRFDFSCFKWIMNHCFCVHFLRNTYCLNGTALHVFKVNLLYIK